MRRVYAITLRLSLGALVLLVGCTRDGVAPADEAKEAAPAESKGGGAGLLKMLRGDDEPPYEFKFTEPPEGPAAPSAEVFGFKLGAVRFADVEAALRQGGHACADTSIRAQMETKRAQERARIAAAEE
ncbi:MAG: hypothetical protein KC636_20035, partial [Myxococcales bacterium]|nr:hypothetical protein [Myxococcales bacterium]